MNNSVFGKRMENVGKHRDIKLVTTEEKRTKLVSKLNYMSILDISKMVMYEFWYDYLKPKYKDK